MRQGSHLGNVFLACLGLSALSALLYGPVASAVAVARAPSFASNDACVGSLRLLSAAIAQYEQGNDERLPPTDTPAHFQAALLPLVHDPSRFVCPDTGLSYTPNPAVSGKSLTEFSLPESVEIVADPRPHADGLTTALFLDGRVERGGVEQGDPNVLLTARARVLVSGIAQYTQDYDGYFPPMQTAQGFQAAVFPYIHSRRDFVSPAAGRPFLPNPALSGVALASVTSPATTVLFRDQPPYTGGQPLVAYVDGHVTHGPPPAPSDVAYLRRICLAVTQYTQDSEETLPTTSDYAAFQSQVSPYLKNNALFVSPSNGLPYWTNPAISGASLFDIPEPVTTELIRDARLNPDGSLNIGYVDGHVRQTLSFVPMALAGGPDDQTTLLWPKAQGAAALWTLAPEGAAADRQAYAVSGKTIAVSVGGDSLARLLSQDADGVVTLQTLSGGQVTASHRFGPYDGWTPLALAAGAGGDSRLLWRRYNGALALWTVSQDGRYLSDVRLYAPTGRTPVGLARSLSGGTFLLLRDASNLATLWTLSAEGRTTAMGSVRPHPGYVPAALAAGADGRPRVLFSRGGGQAEVWTYSAAGAPRGVQSITLAAGGDARSLAVGASGDLRVLWTRPGGAATFQRLSAAGAQTSTAEFTPYQ